jgi:glucose/arabinose dehydrogenase
LVLGLLFGILPAFGEPQIFDDKFTVEEFVSDIPNSPTTMAFVGNDILVLQKTDGQVRLIHDRVLQNGSALDVAVNSDGERGMLGITTLGNTVYLYFTESYNDGGKAISNRIYKYDWNGTNLVNPILLKTLPSDNFYHNGGVMTNFDNKVYAVIGDNGNYGKLQNNPDIGKNDTSVILRVDPKGPYYAIGIRNSFGITFDPQTGNLWDTENGDNDFDEINLVPENFDSGWIAVMGPANQSAIDALPKYGNYVYSDPEFSWQKPVAPTGISFSSSNIMGQKDRVFVGDCNNGNVYRFKLNQDRTGFVFKAPYLADNVLNTGEPMDEILFGSGFGCITDIEEGPDGLLYIVSLSEGKIFRILPKALAETRLQDSANDKRGGCLIATATYGTELAPQVQLLREIRDETLFQTSYGSSFMTSFNAAYYSFSPTISDWERQSPIFKEIVKTAITPMIFTLSILNYVNIDSEQEMLWYGVGIILLNVVVYCILPVFAIMKLKCRISPRN